MKSTTNKAGTSAGKVGGSPANKAQGLMGVNSLDGSTTTPRSGSGMGNSKREKGTAPLEKFFVDSLKDLYYAEQKLTTAIPKMEQAATTEELKEAFSDHLHQTQKHVKRLEKVFKMIGKKAEAKKCEAIEGLVKEAESIISDTEDGSMTRDAALIIAAQKVEHYEIASYGGLVQLALTMNLREAADVLDTTLMEEEDTDYQLTQIAESHINMEAEHEGANYSWSKDEQDDDEAESDNNDDDDDEK